MEKSNTMLYTKSEEDLEQEFETNRKINQFNNGSENRKLPENMIEYIEYLIIENIRNIKYLEKENIPSEVKSHRLQYLENQQQLLLDRLDELKDG